VKSIMICVFSSVLAFAACLAVEARSCSAETNKDNQHQLMFQRVSTELAAAAAAKVSATTLSDKLTLARVESSLADALVTLRAMESSKEPPKDNKQPQPITSQNNKQPQPITSQPKEPQSYVLKAAKEFSNLVPVYSGNEVETPRGFGNTLAAGFSQANMENQEVLVVKIAALNRLQEAHTRAVLDQETLHIPEYTILLNQQYSELDSETQNALVLETIQQERLADEKAVEALANPSFWQTLKWWWQE